VVKAWASPLYNFNGNSGAGPLAGVIRDSSGNLYGTTEYGGRSGAGVVYKVDTTGKEIVLHSFSGGADGGTPQAGVTSNSAGKLYGTTRIGGAQDVGVVFEIKYP